MYRNYLRRAANSSRLAGSRFYATATPTSTGFKEHPPLYPDSFLELQKPQSPSFYTGRQGFHDALYKLEDSLGNLKYTMRKLQLLPLPAHARAVLPHPQPAWMSQEAMTAAVGSKLSTSRYRKLIGVLNEMDELRRIARVSDMGDLEQVLDRILSVFERGDKSQLQARGRRKPVKLDKYGRSYTLGKRKTSSARVWIIPVRQKTLAQTFSVGTDLQTEFLPMGDTHVTTSSILINSVPLNRYFAQPRDRERIIRPIKVAGLLGAYNIFALVRGGGKSGQSGAVAHGIAKGLASHVPEIELILKKAKLTRRDPRMVERKKTGRAKARKAYQWVKR